MLGAKLVPLTMLLNTQIIRAYTTNCYAWFTGTANRCCNYSTYSF